MVHLKIAIVGACVILFMLGWTAIIWYYNRQKAEEKPNEERDQDYFDADPFNEDDILP